jgi:hypothetical protein
MTRRQPIKPSSSPQTQKMKSVRVDTKGETYPEPKKLKDPYGRF